MVQNYKVLLYYKYVEVDNPELVTMWQKELCLRLNLKGRIIIAKEGINGTLEGTYENTKIYIKETTKLKEFADIWFKISKGNGQSFNRLSVKLRKEIVSSYEYQVNPNIQTGKYLTADELHEWINSKKEFYIVDMRNDYEHKSGYFENSILMPIKNFRDLKDTIPTISHLKNKTIVTVCTGGIRCEKASAILLKNDFNDVYQLHGGIVTYMEKYPNHDFLGKLYVFDNRIVIGFNVTKPEHQIVGKCEKCLSKSDNYINCANAECHKHFIVCKKCVEDNNYMMYCSNECKDKLKN